MSLVVSVSFSRLAREPISCFRPSPLAFGHSVTARACIRGCFTSWYLAVVDDFVADIDGFVADIDGFIAADDALSWLLMVVILLLFLLIFLLLPLFFLLLPLFFLQRRGRTSAPSSASSPNTQVKI